jgi:hypothetical protein
MPRVDESCGATTVTSCFAVPVDASSSTIVDAQSGAPPPEGAAVQAARQSRTASIRTIGSEAYVRAATTLLACSRSRSKRGTVSGS